MDFNEILIQANWVDVLFITIIFRICYISVRKGIIVELFKVVGILSAAYFTLHYYSRLGDFLAANSPIDTDNYYIFSYLFIASLTALIFILIRQGFFMIIKVEAIPWLLRWGGLIAGCLRGAFIVSLTAIFLIISNNSYLKGSVRQSYLGDKVTNIAASYYEFIFNNIEARFDAKSKLSHVLFRSLEEK